MSALETVVAALGDWPEPYEQDRYVVVPTFVVYPSGALVQLYISVGHTSAQISDGGGAYDEIIRRGDFGFNALRSLRSFAKRSKMNVDDRGWITSKSVPREQIASYIAFVANLSRDAAYHLVRRFRAWEGYDYRVDLDKFLAFHFGSQVTKKPLLKGLDKDHRFDYAIRTENSRMIVFDAVVPDPNSINSAVVSHLDLARVDRDDVIQRIVYDEQAEWKSADISLLNVGAKTIRFAQFDNFLGQHLSLVDDGKQVRLVS